jgi:hypothetical protein
MLYKLKGIHGVWGDLDPMPFKDMSDLGNLEKDLENLLAAHLLDVLFEGAILMPIFQQRALQAEADIYALNRDGDLFIFELKRGTAGGDAMLQVLRYAQDAGRWTFAELERKYSTYRVSTPPLSLAETHRDAFNLDFPLPRDQFNRRQHLYVVGNAADEDLMAAVDYWKRNGLSAEFLPYRIYEIAGEHYFEFFALPYDWHQNPAGIKGVLFDTNRSYDENCIWEMMEHKRVAAYGDTKEVVRRLNVRDIVFFSHKNVGLVAAAEVVGPVKQEGDEELYRDVRFLTPVPNQVSGIQRYMPFSQVTQVTGKSFYWARTDKVPYLSREEARGLVDNLRETLGGLGD